MKRLCFLLLLALPALPVQGQTTITLTFNLDAVELRDASGNALSLNSTLVLVDVGSSTAVPQAVTGNFAPDDTILGVEAYNQSGIPGPNETKNAFSVTLPATDAGDNIVLEWFPTLTYYSGVEPSAGEAYGAFNPDGATLDSGEGGSAWQVPSGSGTVNLDYITQTDAGTPQSDSDASDASSYANNTVAPAVTPEPAPYALLLSALPLLAWNYRRQIRAGHASR